MAIREFDVVEITKEVVVNDDGVAHVYAPGTQAAVLDVFQPPLTYLIEFVSDDGYEVEQALVGADCVRPIQ